MSDVAAAINAKNGAITATTANGQLRLTAKQTGVDSAITVSNATGGASAIGLDLRGRRLGCLRHDRRQRVHELHEPGDHRDLGRHAEPDRGDGPRRGIADGQSVAGRQRLDHQQAAGLRQGLQRRDQDRDGRAQREEGHQPADRRRPSQGRAVRRLAAAVAGRLAAQRVHLAGLRAAPGRRASRASPVSRPARSARATPRAS